MTAQRIRVIATPEVAAGFLLAGMETEAAVRSDDTVRRIIAVAGDRTTGVLLVEQPLLELLPPADRRALDARAVPIVLAFPTPPLAEQPVPVDTIVLDILRRAVGYRVRLQ